MDYRFEHRIVAGYHVITSPDLKGFHVSAKTRAEAEARVAPVLAMFLDARRALSAMAPREEPPV